MKNSRKGAETQRMKKSFYSNLAFLLFINLLVKPFWILGIDRSVQNTVGVEAYGLYFALFNFSVLFQILLDFGINNFNNRSVAQDEGFISRHLPDILVLKFLLALCYAVITLVCAYFFQYDSHQVFLLSLLTVSQVISSFLLYARSNISGLHHFKIDSILSVLDKLLMIMVCGFLLWGPFREKFSIEWFIYAQIATLLLTLLVAFAIVLVKTPAVKLKWDVSGIKEVIKKTYPYALLGLLMSVYYRVDGVMLEQMLPDGKYEAGVYAASFRLLDTANMLGFLFATLLLPMFSKMLIEKKDVHLLAGSSFKAIMAAAVFTVTICFFYRQEIIRLLYPDSTEYWSDIFGLLMPAFLGVCTVYIYGSLLTANGSMKALNAIALGGMVLNIVLNFILIPQYKAWGSTLATLITQSLVALVHIYAVKKIIPFEINLRQVTRFLVFCAGMILVFYATKQLSAIWVMNLLIGLIASVALALVMKIIEVRHFMGLFKKYE